MAFELKEAMEVLERTPATLRELLSGLSPAWIEANEGPDTFSPFDIMGHLIQGERKDWIARARIILDEDENRSFEPFDRFAQKEASRGKALGELLDEFEVLRRENLAVLRGWNLTDREFAMKGEHPDLGPVTLRQLLATWVTHDLGHIAQASRVMAKRYHDDVGPWRRHIPVLDDRSPGSKRS